MARITTANLLLVTMGLLASVLASPTKAPLERPARPIGVPCDRPPYSGPRRTWPAHPPSLPPDPEPEQPPAGEAPIPSLAPLRQPTPAGQDSSEERCLREPDGSINGDPSATTVDENPTSPTPPAGSSPADESPEPGATGSSSGAPSDADDDAANMGGSNDGDGRAASNDRALVITLSTVLSVVALFLIAATLIACFRVKNRRMPFLARGISPIDDEEIESWKRRTEEKFMPAPSARRLTASSSPGSSPGKSRSVIVYHSAVAPPFGFEDSPPSAAHDHARNHPRRSHSQSRPHTYYPPHTHTTSVGSVKPSLDLLPQPPPVLARAPNSRPGLTDEAIEGDEAFLPPSHKRQTSRLSKKHSFSRSRSSSMSMWPAPSSSSSPSSPPRRSDEGAAARTSYSYERKHARIYSDSSVPPRLSLDDVFLAGGLSPRPPPRGGQPTPESQIGRAIG